MTDPTKKVCGRMSRRRRRKIAEHHDAMIATGEKAWCDALEKVRPRQMHFERLRMIKKERQRGRKRVAPRNDGMAA